MSCQWPLKEAKPILSIRQYLQACMHKPEIETCPHFLDFIEAEDFVGEEEEESEEEGIFDPCPSPERY